MKPKRQVLVLVKGGQRFMYRWTRGSEATLLATLLQSVRDKAHPLVWSDMLPVMVRLRDLILSGDDEPVVIEATP